MQEITVGVDGMMCGMCGEPCKRRSARCFPDGEEGFFFPRSPGKTVIVIEEDIPDEKIREVIDKTGYTVTGITRKPYEKKGFFSRLKKD